MSRVGRWHSDLASLYRHAGCLAEAEQLQCAALALLEQLAAEYPESPYYRQELGVAQQRVGTDKEVAKLLIEFV